MNEILKGLLPTLASAVLGPLGGVAVAAIGKVLGIDHATTESVSKAFQDGKITPDQLSELKKLELQYQNEEKERGFRYADLEFKDREGNRKDTDSARLMQMATRSIFPAVLSTGITIGFFGVLGWMLYDPNVVNSPPLLIMLGALGTAFAQVINYWLGSTQTSQTKTAMIATAGPVK
jgi:hypothetical protein